MLRLEDILTTIIERRASGVETEDIARELEMGPEVIKLLEESTIRSIRKYTQSDLDQNMLSGELGISRKLIEEVTSFYDIKDMSIHIPGLGSQTAEQGKTINEIVEEVGTGEQVRDIASLISAAAFQKAYGKSLAFGKVMEVLSDESKMGGYKYIGKDRLERLTEIFKEYQNSPETGDFAEKMAIAYIIGLKRKGHYNTIIGFPKLVKMFELYSTAEKSGEEVSIIEIGNRSGISTMSVSRILKKVGLEPLIMRGHKERSVTPKEKKEAIDRSRELEMSNIDIAYFVGVPWYVVNDSMSGRKGVKRGIKSFGRDGLLTHRFASQIYEAQDLGFDVGETKYLLDLSERFINHALEHKSEIAPVIITSLDTIYPETKHDRPYRQAS